MRRILYEDEKNFEGVTFNILLKNEKVSRSKNIVNVLCIVELKSENVEWEYLTLKYEIEFGKLIFLGCLEIKIVSRIMRVLLVFTFFVS